MKARALVVGVALASAAGCGDATDAAAPAVSAAPRARAVLDREPLAPLPEPPDTSTPIALLGKKLFDDKRLSADGTIACASCHVLAKGGADDKAVSLGIGGQKGGVNAPTVFNAGLNVVQFWDGRAKTLEDQVNGPLTHPAEMGSTWDATLAMLKADTTYAAAFRAAFPDGVTADNVRRAIATFERTLVTSGSPFDAWLLGDKAALSGEAKEGYETFKAVGCIACHQGANAGGNMFQKFGVFGDYFKDRGGVTEGDLGRYNVTKKEADRFVFRVPVLRNVDKTAPYFHDGRAATLEEAVAVMAKYQLGRTLTDSQSTGIIAFLKSLSGPLPKGAL